MSDFDHTSRHVSSPSPQEHPSQSNHLTPSHTQRMGRATTHRMAEAPQDYQYFSEEEGDHNAVKASALISPQEKQEIMNADIEARLYIHEVLLANQGEMIAAMETFRGFAIKKRSEAEPKNVVKALHEAASFVLGKLSKYVEILEYAEKALDYTKPLTEMEKFDIDDAAQTLITIAARLWAKAEKTILSRSAEILAPDIHTTWLSSPPAQRRHALHNLLQTRGIRSGHYDQMVSDMELELDRQITVWRCRTGQESAYTCAADRRLEPTSKE